MSSATPPSDLLEAVIIGAGPAGISAAKELLAVRPDLRGREVDLGGRTPRGIVVLEESDAVGGMWHRSGGAHRDDGAGRSYLSDADDGAAPYAGGNIPVATSPQPLYEGLVANLPKFLMCFRDAPYPHDVPLKARPYHAEEYLRRYAAAHGLLPHVRFRSRVVRCAKAAGDGGGHWEVRASERREGVETEATYRGRRLVVCTGRHRYAHVPSLRGARHLRGEMLHSSAFRGPHQFEEGSTVLIVGGGVSGADIANILLRSGRVNVLVSMREWRIFPHAVIMKKVKRAGLVRPTVSHIDEEGCVHFDRTSPFTKSDDTPVLPVRPDAIIFATGYRYDYPFLPKDGGFIQRGGLKMRRLYLHMICADDPSLVFIHVPTKTLSAILLIEFQTRWYAQYIQGKLKVTDEIMEAEILSRKDELSDSLKFLGFVPYCNSLARMVGDYTFWEQMLWIRLPMMLRSLGFSMVQKLVLALFRSKPKEA